MADYLLELSPDVIRFEPVSKLTNVFFDEANCQVFAVRSGGTTGVVVKGPDEPSVISFRMADKGEVNCIKFSPDKKVLSIQRSYRSVEFINFNGDLDSVTYSQSCKGKSSKILGFSWTGVNEVVFVTDHGIEHYQVVPEKRVLKILKTYSVPDINWYVYHAQSSLLLLSSGSLCNVMHPYQFKPGMVYKLSKFEIDLPATPKTQKAVLLERDVSIATIYGKTCIMVLRHQPHSTGTPGAEIVIYTLPKDGLPRKTDILKLDMSGRFAVNVLDDVIVVHQQSSKRSMIYDIRMPAETDGYVSYHNPLVPPQPIKPFVLKVPVLPSHNPNEVSSISCELYSPNWVVFQPNIIIDAKLGCLWYVKMNLKPLVDLIPDKALLIDFLLLRKNSRAIIAEVCCAVIAPQEQSQLPLIAKIFNKLGSVCQQDAKATKSDSLLAKKMPLLFSQSDMYLKVFHPVFKASNVNAKFVIAVILEYIRALTKYNNYVQDFIMEMLIDLLVKNKRFYQLHQFLQYNILKDSKELACILLSLQDIYAPAHQLALDMFQRLQRNSKDIIEVLLSRDQILPALHFIRSIGKTDSLSAQKYLSVAMGTGDDYVFYSVFKYFESRNQRLRGSPCFEPDEHCEQYVKHFDGLFGRLYNNDK